MEKYSSLNHAVEVTEDDAYAQGSTEIWYCKPNIDHWDRRTLTPDASKLRKTHVKLGSINTDSKEHVFSLMQGENWSPQGEANELIARLGLHHTSMSIGDVVVAHGEAWICRPTGWELIEASAD